MLAQYLLLLVATRRLALMITLLSVHHVAMTRQLDLNNPMALTITSHILLHACLNLAWLTDSLAACFLELSLATDIQGNYYSSPSTSTS